MYKIKYIEYDDNDNSLIQLIFNKYYQLFKLNNKLLL